MTKFLLIDVNDIQSNVPRSTFPEAELDRLADLILASDGLIRPLILKRTDIDQYVVLDGDLEYYAAVRAKEKDSRKGDLVNAFVVSAKTEEVVEQQLQILQKSIELPAKPMAPSGPSPVGVVADSGLSARLDNFEARFEQFIKQLRDEKSEDRRSIDARLKSIEEKLIPKANPLDALNTWDQRQLMLTFKRSKIGSESKIEKLVEAICQARTNKANQQFDDYDDFYRSVRDMNFKEGRSNVLGEKTFLNLLNALSGI